MLNLSVSAYPSLLPFLIVEALSTDKTCLDSISVKISEQGWAWLVAGKKLFVWRYNSSKSDLPVVKTRRQLSPCYELQLPPSELVNKACLINIYANSSNASSVPSALAVSPEGIVRFWSNVSNERFSESSTVNTQGHELHTLTTLTQNQYLISTTTGTVFMLNIDQKTRHVFSCFALNTSSGILSGISRRVTNLFFSSMSADPENETKRSVIVTSGTVFYTLTSNFKLKKWAKSGETSNELQADWDLHGQVYTSLSIEDDRQVKIWPLDVITTNDERLFAVIIILNTRRNNSITYATFMFNPMEGYLLHMTPLKSYTGVYTNETEEQLLSLRFVERNLTGRHCHLYDGKLFFLIEVNNDIIDAIDYGNQDDMILGAGMSDGKPLIFTQRDGLKTISTKEVMQNESVKPVDANPDSKKVNQTTDDEMVLEEKPDTHDSFNQTNQSNVSADVNKSQPLVVPDELEFMKNSADYEWLKNLEMRQYSEASEVMSRLARETKTIHEHDRNFLVSLSKLAKYAVE